MSSVTRNRAALSLALCCLIQASAAQLSYHTDANSNSFTLKTPGLQQSFSRYFGGAGGKNLLSQPQAAASQQQPVQTQAFGQQNALPQAQLQSQSFPSFQYANGAGSQYQQSLQYPQQQSSPYAPRYQPAQASAAAQPQQPSVQEYAETLQRIQRRQQQQQEQLERLIAQQMASQPTTKTDPMQAAYYAYQQQQEQYAQQQRQYQQQLLTQLYRDQPPAKQLQSHAHAAQTQPQSQQYYTAEQYADFLAQQHSSVMHHQQNQLQHQYASLGYSLPKSMSAANVSSTTISPYTSTATPSVHNFLGAQYSPSDKVSHVKFTSGSLNYNF